MNKIKNVFYLAVATIAITLLTSCTYPFGKAELSLKTENNVSLPQVSGFVMGDNINSQLSDMFLPYAEKLKVAVSDSDGALSVNYELKEDENSNMFSREYTVVMTVSNDTGSLEVASAKVSGMSNVSVSSAKDVSWLDSAELVENCITLHSIGIDLDMNDLESDASEEFADDLFIKLYEGLTVSETDISDVTVGDAFGDNFKKSLKLGLIDFYYNLDSYEYQPTLTMDSLIIMSEKITKDIAMDAYGKQSQTVTGSEFSEMLKLFYNMYLRNSDDSAKYQWSDLGAVDFDAIIDKAGMSDYAITRRDCAEILWRITKAGPNYGVSYNDENLVDVDDSDSIWVRRTMTYNLMTYYGASVEFAPESGLTFKDAINTAEIYMSSRYSNMIFSQNDSDYTPCSKYDVISVVCKIADYFKTETYKNTGSLVRKTVINDRDYDWFYSQHNTGAFSDVNCMPSIATMAAHWYDQNSSATVEKMRDTNPIDGGWTAYELHHGLECYNIPYEVGFSDMDSILGALDEGKIVLAQYSDRPFDQSGHCYVIYGYRRVGDSVTFIVNDSDSYSAKASIFGRKDGNGDEIEGSFAVWSISRFVSDITIIG